MAKPKMIKEIRCKKAEDLLREMSVSRGVVWHSMRSSSVVDTHAWIFRGMTNSTWGLRPAAFREDALTLIMAPSQVHYRVPDAKTQRGLEDSGVVGFLSDADQMGFSIPADRPELRDPRQAIPDYDPHEFPPIAKLHMYALAQHYGIPTRLLDWTTRPLVAAYFAVRDSALAQSKGVVASAPSCAVWALNRPFVEAVATKATFDPAILIVTAPKATNQYLAAQGGLFTLVQPHRGDPHPVPDLDEVLRTNVSRIPEEWRKRCPLAYKFTLPTSETRRALRMLSFEGIHAGTVFPGLRGVVEAIRERKAFALTHEDLLKGVSRRGRR